MSRRVSRTRIAVAALGAAALALTGCSAESNTTSTTAADATPTDSTATDSTAAGKDASGESYKIGISQLVQHPALDAATEGFKQAFEDAGVDVEWVEQNANGEQATAVTIAQQFAGQNLDAVLAVATPAAQAMVQNVTDIPVFFTAVTDPVEAQLVNSMDAPGGNVTGTSDETPIKDQFDLIGDLVADATKVGIVYSSGEINSQIQVDNAKQEAESRGWTVEAQTVTSVNEIPQAVEALGDVDVFYVPTDNMVVSGIASLIQAAEQKQIPVVGAEAGTVEGGAVATIGIDYTKLGYQTGEMALKVLRDGADTATMPVETATEFSYVVNPDAAEAQGVTIPDAILNQAETV